MNATGSLRFNFCVSIDQLSHTKASMETYIATTLTCSSLQLRSNVDSFFPGFLSTMLSEEHASRAMELALQR